MNEYMVDQTLKRLEALRACLLRESAYIESDQAIKAGKFRPNEGRDPIYINGYPVFQFCYRGEIPLYDKEDPKYTATVRDYYLQATYNSYDFSNMPVRFEKAVMIIQHFFTNRSRRDLDNRNRKYLIDAIRHTGLIKDDDFNVLSILEEGFCTEEEPCVKVFLLEKRNFQDFLLHKETFLFQ
ncbi:hypothetical protein [Pseudobacillus badius]|uniref:hypothetical protein n=1 Tax=Bacillus badius TaxID=1455 RepID=UPI001CBEBAEE|nr:hypothetical protein [Bacillus badius]UAT32452.1 hypothetical protein K7T73_09695 [Bacillus badius]GLY12709.1 hypothetical protein Bbad01_39250 [Bacillus badius]